MQDTEVLADRLPDVEERINRAVRTELDIAIIEVLADDKGYYNVDHLWRLQPAGIKTAPSDPPLNRNLQKLSKGNDMWCDRPGEPLNVEEQRSA